MLFSFKATLCKVGINPCVAVPLRITGKLVARKGYIPVKGKIKQQEFVQNLVPVKNAEYRLYLNGPILKGAGIGLGDRITIYLQQDTEPEKRDPAMPPALKKRLEKEGLQKAFDSLAYYRKKEILKYLGFLKTEASLLRNIEKIVSQLKEQ